MWKLKQHRATSDEVREFIEPARFQRQRNIVPWTLTLCNAIIAGLTMFFSFRYNTQCPGGLVDARYQNTELNAALKSISTYTPLLDEIDMSIRRQRVFGDFKNESSIFRQDPSPEVDEAWNFFPNRIFTTNSFTLAENLKRPETAVKAPASWGRGDDAYVYQLDVFHEIHCLNWLRKDLNWEYYYGDTKPSQWWKDHRTHCIDVLLQTLMCHADLDTVPYNWIRHHPDSEPVPNPDFNVLKMCRNFDAVVAWAEKNAVADGQQRRKELRAPDDAVIYEWPF